MTEKYIVYFTCVLSGTINYSFINFLILRVMHQYNHVKTSRIILSGFLMAFLYQTLFFIIEYIFYYPNIMNMMVETILLYPLPAFVFIYYLILRKAPKLSAFHCLEALGDILSLQYVLLIVFRLFCSLWVVAYGEYIIRYSTTVDMMAMLSTVTAAALSTLITSRFRGRFRPVIDSQTALSKQKIRSKLINVFFSALSSYSLLILVSVLLLSERMENLGINDALIYLVLLLIFGYRIIEAQRKRRLISMEASEAVTNEYVRSLTQVTNELRGVRHDWNNILQVYDGYLTVGDMDGLKNYHSSVVKASTKIQMQFEIISSLSHRRALYNALQFELQKMHQQKINLEMEDIDLIADAAMGDLDLCRILGNLLDNAIAAAAESKERLLCIRCTSQEESISVEIINSTIGEVELKNIFEEGWTTKPNHTGLGLYTVRTILSAYDGCFMLVDYKDNLFTTALTLSRQQEASLQPEIPVSIR